MPEPMTFTTVTFHQGGNFSGRGKVGEMSSSIRQCMWMFLIEMVELFFKYFSLPGKFLMTHLIKLMVFLPRIQVRLWHPVLWKSLECPCPGSGSLWKRPMWSLYHLANLQKSGKQTALLVQRRDACYVGNQRCLLSTNQGPSLPSASWITSVWSLIAAAMDARTHSYLCSTVLSWTLALLPLASSWSQGKSFIHLTWILKKILNILQPGGKSPGFMPTASCRQYQTKSPKWLVESSAFLLSSLPMAHAWGHCHLEIHSSKSPVALAIACKLKRKMAH